MTYVLCIAVTGILIALFMGSEVRQDLDESNRMASGKIATLGIESHFNMVSRIARNIMLGSDLKKDLKRYDASITSIEAYFKDLDRTALDAQDKRLIDESRRYVLEYLEVAYVFCQELEAVLPAQRGEHYARFGQVATPLAEKTMHATTEVHGFVKSIRDSAQKGQDTVLATTEDLRTATEFVSETETALSRIVDHAASTADSIRTIAEAAGIQSGVSSRVKTGAECANDAATVTATVMHDLVTAVHSLGSETTRLERIIDVMTKA